MSPRIIFNLSQAEANGLFRLSIRDHRDYRNELRFLIVEEIIRREISSSSQALEDEIKKMNGISSINGNKKNNCDQSVVPLEPNKHIESKTEE